MAGGLAADRGVGASGEAGSSMSDVVWVVARSEEDSGFDQVLAVYANETDARVSARRHLESTLRADLERHQRFNEHDFDVSSEMSRALAMIREESWGYWIRSDDWGDWIMTMEVSVYPRRVRTEPDDTSGEGDG